MVKFKDFSRPLSVFQVLFKANSIFKDFSRQSCIFKYFSSQCEPWYLKCKNVPEEMWKELNLNPYEDADRENISSSRSCHLVKKI